MRRIEGRLGTYYVRLSKPSVWVDESLGSVGSGVGREHHTCSIPRGSQRLCCVFGPVACCGAGRQGCVRRCKCLSCCHVMLQGIWNMDPDEPCAGRHHEAFSGRPSRSCLFRKEGLIAISDCLCSFLRPFSRETILRYLRSSFHPSACHPALHDEMESNLRRTEIDRSRERKHPFLFNIYGSPHHASLLLLTSRLSRSKRLSTKSKSIQSVNRMPRFEERRINTRRYNILYG